MNSNDFGCDLNFSDWTEVLSACLGKMMAIQTACAQLVVRDRDWNVDFQRGTIAFGGEEFPLQFLGSEATSSNTWLWGWENINGFDEALLKVAEETRSAGERWGLDALTTAEFSLDDNLNGHTLAMVACGISPRELCYYRGPHSGGAILVAFTGAPPEVFAPVDLQSFVSITTRCLQQFPIRHRVFVESFLNWNRTPFAWDGDTIVARFGQELYIRFEKAGEHSRICGITTTLTP